ncbi:hypothetical protein [Snodgrassella sp. CFCC 13594]|uniref:hypothetical protein n=1 Tax=Snodgrassella sp. CFCC 13594 TaxID=1775559 RepID=UPI0008310DD8|nr:hypothetical protein [Snodgrassella sp. CFCC 13594]
MNSINNRVSAKSGLFFAAIYAFLVISVCQVFMHDFFNVDDALNEMLGFFKQFGRIWAQGQIPFIVDTLYVGGNSMVELGKGVFLPQNVIASLLAYHFDYIRLPGLFLAFFNITLITFSAVVIAKNCNISRKYAYVFAAFVAIQPIFLYQYSGGWWNAADGQAWATASIAALLALRSHVSLFNIVLNFLAALFLLASGWPHGVIAYAIFVLFTLIAEWQSQKDLKSILWLATPTLLALLLAIPIYSEYVFSGSLLDRPNGFNNDGQFLSPAWSSIVMGFFPSYYEFIHYFGGYRLMLVPLGFSILLLPATLCYRQISVLWHQSPTLKWLVALVVIFFLMTQMPSQFGPLRWPFRFLPFLSMGLCLLTCYILDKAPVKRSTGARRVYGVIVLAAGVLAFMNGLGMEIQAKHIWLQVLSVLLLLAVPWLLRRQHSAWLVGSALVCLLIMLAGTKSLGYKERFVSFAKLPQQLQIEPKVNLEGFVLSLSSHSNRIYLNDLNSAQFGVYNIKAINGYSPVGNKALDALLPHDTAHALFKPNETLVNVLQLTKYGTCQAVLMRISTIIMQRADFEQHQRPLKLCGYIDVQDDAARGDVFVSLPKAATQGWVNNPPSVLPADAAVTMIRHNNNQDILQIEADAQARTLIFPRVWWPGYSAFLNGKSLKVDKDDMGVLTKVVVPANEAGRLELTYFPYTWRWLWPFPLMALMILAGMLTRFRKRPRDRNN